MESFLNFIGSIFGYVLIFFNNIFGNFGVALIAFTIFTRLLMFPLSVTQHKSSAKMQSVQPKMKKLQEMYGDNKEKYNEEVQKLYEREGVNPSSGCLPMLIQLPIFYGLYRAIVRPITCTLHLDVESGALATAIERIETLADVYTPSSSSYYSQISIIEAVRNIGGEYARYGFTAAEATALEPIEKMSSGFNFLGIDLLSIPEFWNTAIILTFLVFICSAGSMFISNKINGAMAQSAQGCSPNMMGVMMGLFSAWISLSVPAAMALYWSCSSMCAPLQSWIVKKFYSAPVLNAKDEARQAAKLRLEEGEVIRSMTSMKGAREFPPVYEEKKELKQNSSSASGGKSGRSSKSRKKKKSGSGANNSSSDYQGKKKR